MIEKTDEVVCSVECCAMSQVPPSHLLVENVVGFEGSRTRARMVEVIQAAGYAIQVSLLPPDSCTLLETQQHLETHAVSSLPLHSACTFLHTFILIDCRNSGGRSACTIAGRAQTSLHVPCHEPACTFSKRSRKRKKEESPVMSHQAPDMT